MTVIIESSEAKALDVHTPPPLVHWSESPYTHGLCGKKLTDGSEGAVVDCVVCIELAGGER